MKRFCKGILGRFPFIGHLLRQLEKQGAFPAGHYYSPIPDEEEVSAYIGARNTPEMNIPGICLNERKQYDLLNDYIQYYAELPFPETQEPGCRYYYQNGMFSYADAIFLYSFLRRCQPRRIIEIGSGFSSAVMLDTIDRFFSNRPEITFIEPYPERLRGLLTKDDENHVRIIERKIQEVHAGLFSSLESGDFVFIDSSHVVKCGSDLQVLMFEILPQLPSGIFVHFHDIFYPFDYPSEWLREGRYWNENYFLRAFLSYNSQWSIYFFNTFAALSFGELIRDRMPLCARNPGGSLYLQRISGPN